MATEPCEGCGADVPIAGGISGIWSSDPQSTGGMTLSFEDDTAYFLCFDCLESLPEEPDVDDVRRLCADK
ncbi:MAG: hypothetical protein PPP58_12055 [Natronomonas sp.]